MIKADEARKLAENARMQHLTTIDDTMGNYIKQSANVGCSYIMITGTLADEIREELEECGYKINQFQSYVLVTW